MRCWRAARRRPRQPESGGDPPAVAGRPTCFQARQVSDFRPLDRSSLIVYAPSRNNAYHVRISPPSIELRSANAIGFVSRSNRICGYAGDSLRIDRNDRFRYSVVSVRRLDDVALEALLGAGGGDEADTGPQDTAGAEIERDIDDDTEQ